MKKLKGECKNCTRPTINRTYCEFHRDIWRIRSRVYHKKYMEKNISKGLCIKCANPSERRNLCVNHLEKRRAYGLKRLKTYGRIMVKGKSLTYLRIT